MSDYWRDIQQRMAAAGAYDGGTLDSHLVDPPAPDAWDECAACGHDRDDHRPDGCDVGIFHVAHGGWWPCHCHGFREKAS